MKLFVDDIPIEGVVADEDSVADVLRHVQQEICQAEQMVVGLRCDGREVPADAMGETLQRHASAVNRLDVLTGTKAELVIDAMEQASQCLSDTEAACREVADLLTQGNSAKGASMLGDCLRIWQQIHDAVSKSLSLLELDTDTMTIRDQPLHDLIVQPKEVLLQVRDALQAKDHVMLADLLLYEFSEVTNNWHDLVSRLRQEALERQAAP